MGRMGDLFSLVENKNLKTDQSFTDLVMDAAICPQIALNAY